MAEPTPAPALPSTADAAPYVPVSWLAVAAAVVAGTYAAALLVLGAVAFLTKKPLLLEFLYYPPVAAVVLAFAARRVIRNAEGTRTGGRLADAAWWTAVVLGLGYVAYARGIEYSISQDAGNEVKKWVALVEEGQTERAFYQTLAPGARQGIARDDSLMLQARFRDELLAFTNSDLLALARRNRGALEFAPGGVVEWSYKPDAVDCTFAGTVTCPEGSFPVLVPLKGVEGVTGGESGSARQWMIVRPQGGGFVQHDKVERTPYGWLVGQLENDGGAFGKAYIASVAGGMAALGPAAPAYLYHGFVADGGKLNEWVAVVRDPLRALALAAPLGADAAATGRGYAQHLATEFYRLPGGGVPTPGQRDRFLASWNVLGLVEAGTRLKDAGGGVPDKESFITLTDAAVEVYVPVELPVLSTAGKLETARGRLVVACKDPELLAEVKARKAAAAADPRSRIFSEAVAWTKPLPWRVARVESDLAPVTAHQPGGPPGMPGGG